MSASSGSHRVTGSSSLSLPSSISIRAAIEVTGLVMEAMRKRVSRVIGSPASTSRRPTVLTWAISPLRQTRVTKPERSPASTTAWSAAGICASPASTKPPCV
jgi:hypothetical protein